jgi:hypothetical protein
VARLLVMESVGHSGRDGMVKRKPSVLQFAVGSVGWLGRAGRRLEASLNMETPHILDRGVG